MPVGSVRGLSLEPERCRVEYGDLAPERLQVGGDDVHDSMAGRVRVRPQDDLTGDTVELVDVGVGPLPLRAGGDRQDAALWQLRRGRVGRLRAFGDHPWPGGVGVRAVGVAAPLGPGRYVVLLPRRPGARLCDLPVRPSPDPRAHRLDLPRRYRVEQLLERRLTLPTPEEEALAVLAGMEPVSSAAERARAGPFVPAPLQPELAPDGLSRDPIAHGITC